MLPFFHSRWNRKKYSKMETDPSVPVLILKTALCERFVPYHRPKYKAMGVKMQSITMSDQKSAMLFLRVRNE